MTPLDTVRAALEFRIMSWEEDNECTPCNVQQLIIAAGIIRELYSKWNAARADMAGECLRELEELKWKAMNMSSWQYSENKTIDKTIDIIRAAAGGEDNG